ncbi:MAG: hypothetical protein RL173_17 [Fibrobacterota bacterium]|jgi:hypothetical protein
MSFPVNLLSTEEIHAELQRRKREELDAYRAQIAEHKRAINVLEIQIQQLKIAAKARGRK